MATRATDARFKQRRLRCTCFQRLAAGAAQRVRSGYQAVADGHTLVKHKALALPQAVFRRHRLQVFQDAAFQMEYLLKALCAQIGGRFFAADAAGAEHGDFGLLAGWGGGQLGLRVQPGRQFGKGFQLRVDGVGKAANRHLVVIAGVHHHHVRVGNQGIPVGGLHIGSGHQIGADAGPIHGDDFLFQPHLHAVKRWLVGPGFLVLQVGQQRVGAQVGQHGAHIVGSPGNGAVDALLGQQNQALDLALLTQGQQRRLARLKIGQGDELVKGGGKKGGGHGAILQCCAQIAPGA